MQDKNGKHECILTKFLADVPEYISKRTRKFLQERVYRSQICDFDHAAIVASDISEWEHFHQVFIDEAIRQ